ncbi:MAG: hypothetical protein [Wendovervirus sonii]|uniref:Uncharacterized protein n=1 Tax=phage Lak_Megaphage_Sonny TaxID=3109229 RepID=A0ABZ0Z6W6_9CAUD|nr:MAG: hypothetical protein [phage Lak_Megaphage_Sonny]
MYKKLYENIMKRLSNVLSENFEITNDGYENFGKDFEDNEGELSRLQKKTVQTKSGMDVYYRFGKNGRGLTKEFMAIGEDIYQLSRKYYIVLDNQSYFDMADDVYDIMVHCTPMYDYNPNEINEGVWGFKPNESDSYWDYTHNLTKDLLKQLIDGLKQKKYNYEKYTYMGLVNGFLKADKIWDEVIYSHGIELYQAYEKAFNDLNEDKDNKDGWDDFNRYKKELKKTFNDFKKILKDKFGFEIEKKLKEKQEADKKPKKLTVKAVNESMEIEMNWEIPEELYDLYLGTTKDLKDGIYEAKYFSCTFKLKNGDCYYFPIGVRHSEKHAAWKLYRVKNGMFDEVKVTPFHMSCYDNVTWEIPEWASRYCIGTTKDLNNGIYKAKYYAHMFELENGSRYYSPIGVMRSDKMTPFEYFQVYNGEIKDTD